ncbi:hypothetical protein PR048_025367 [Dryococelus australis]|uniref:Uncharacterized protein n=1 Tax=Dryococelus australis TaxID=614101 RepID=A0ABQ9GR77_9NEOP|nr:hypothetical protein PR048_025367 [Dryococelus australis]
MSSQHRGSVRSDPRKKTGQLITWGLLSTVLRKQNVWREPMPSIVVTKVRRSAWTLKLPLHHATLNNQITAGQNEEVGVWDLNPEPPAPKTGGAPTSRATEGRLGFVGAIAYTTALSSSPGSTTTVGSTEAGGFQLVGTTVAPSRRPAVMQWVSTTCLHLPIAVGHNPLLQEQHAGLLCVTFEHFHQLQCYAEYSDTYADLFIAKGDDIGSNAIMNLHFKFGRYSWTFLFWVDTVPYIFSPLLDGTSLATEFQVRLNQLKEEFSDIILFPRW